MKRLVFLGNTEANRIEDVIVKFLATVVSAWQFAAVVYGCPVCC